jgi:hypothetical protein
MAWSAARDDHGIAAYGVQRRRLGSTRWEWEGFSECERCFVDETSAPSSRSISVGLKPGWEFRVYAIDDALQFSRPSPSAVDPR